MDYATRNTSLKKPETTDPVLIGDINDNIDIIDNCICKGEWDAATDPGVGDDSADGYVVGSTWINTTAHKVFICESSAAGAAVWRQIWPLSSPSANFDFGSYKVTAETFESDVATGTAPLVVASTTRVSNLNVANSDKLDGLDDTAFVKVDGSQSMSASLSLDQIATPDAPASGKTRLYTKSDGKIYRRAYGGSETEVGPAADLSTCLLADGSRALSSALIIDQIATPDAPSSGKTKFYTKSDGKLYYRPYGGSETEVGGTSSSASGDVYNLIQNGSFEQMDTAGVPIGWVKIGTPTLLQDTGESDGYGGTKAIKITSGGAGNEGLQFTLKQLKASTTYAVYVRAKSTSGDTSKVWTTGATSNLEDTGTSTSFETLSGTFTTDSTPTDVVLKIGSDNNTDVVWFDELIVTEGSSVPTRWNPAKGYYIINLSPVDWEIYTAGLDTGAGANRSIRRHNFDQTTEEFVNKDIKIPSGVKPDGSVVFEAFGFAASSSASKYIKLKFYHIAKAAGEIWNTTYNSITTGDLSCNSTQDALDHFVWQSPLATLDWVALDDIGIRLSRVAPSGTNLAADWCLINFRILIPMMW